MKHLCGLRQKTDSVMAWTRNSKRYFVASVCVVFFGGVGIIQYLWSRETSQFSHPNYFMEMKYRENASYTISTPTCKIMNMTPVDQAIMPLLKPKEIPPDCSKSSPRWTYVNGSMLMINSTALKLSGYSMRLIRCCYQAISRVEQSLHDYDKNADTKFRMSSTCYPLAKHKNALAVEFIRVQCTPNKYWVILPPHLYVMYHALVQPNKNSVLIQKIQNSRNLNFVPPNVIMLGIDSLSRVNFHRTMKMTARYLTEIGAEEMLGYTKVGENTFPNAVPFLTGYSESDLMHICYNRSLAQDSCPYLWKRFNSSGFISAHVEDSPRLNIFNYLKTGFVEQQVDFYLRPFMLSIYGKSYTIPCIGPDTVDENVLTYISDLVKMSQDKRTPLFLFSWLTNLAHDDMNKPLFADRIYENFLRQMDLENTILFFMSDHGMRFGEFRETDHGWFEDKLPNFWVYLSPEIQRRKPLWVQNLRINAKRLTSPYDLYHTLVHILDEFTDSSAQIDSEGVDGIVVPRRYGTSLFREIPLNRTCEGAGIVQEYCPCDIPYRIPIESVELKEVVDKVLSFLNTEKLPPQCSKLTLKNITAGASTKSYDESQTWWNYIASFTVEPGDFLFEATAKYDTQTKEYTLGKRILRMNSISRPADCVHDTELQRFCYCV